MARDMPTRDPATGEHALDDHGDGSELIGTVIDGRYRLESILGIGGMGVVYRAAHIGLRRQVAVKILQPALAASPEVRSRFEREAVAIGKIDHPNCVAVYDVGRLPDGALYLAMELLEGTALAHVIEHEGQLAPARALRIFAHVLRGLDHIHGAGLVHRDMKPENIFLVHQEDDPEFAKILDFGIAKPMAASELDDGVKLTQAGMAFGTPIYMAPEQALGNPLDGRADLYSASVVAYEMLCGQTPFYSDDKLEVMSMHTARPVPPMRTRLVKNAQAVPAAVEKLIARGLTKRPNDRYPTAAAYLDEVMTVLANLESSVRQDTIVTTGSQPLVTETGSVRIADDQDPAELGGLADAIDALDGIAEPHGAAAIGDAIDAAIDSAPRTPTGPGSVIPVFRPPAPTGLSGYSGVGIGLPQTGPGGVPVFVRADQPAQLVPPRLPLPSDGVLLVPPPAPKPARKRTRIVAGVVGAAIVVGVVIAVATTRGSGHAEPTTPAGLAAQALERGDPAKAIAMLDAQKAAIDKDSRAQLVLGDAHAARHESAAALAAYKRALMLEPALEADPALRANLAAMTDDKDPAVIGGAFDLWAGHTHDDHARTQLAASAVSETLERRKAVRPVIDTYKLADQIDWLTAYAFDLEQEVGCEHRKQAVAKLRALGDPRAIPVLERAVKRLGKTGPYRGKAINACLVDDANAALEYLRGLDGSGASGSGAGGSGAGTGSGS
jgi:serine/threonine-protein kinase